MRKLTYFIGASVDGFIAGPTGEIDMCPTPPEYLSSEYGDALPTAARQDLGIRRPTRPWRSRTDVTTFDSGHVILTYSRE